jgi:hypothetical protein
MAQRKLEIHLAVCASILLDVIFQIGYQAGGSLQGLYVFHSLAFATLYFAVATYLNQASKVVYIEGRMKALYFLLLSTGIALILTWAVASFECMHAVSFRAFVGTQSYAVLGWLEATSLVFLAVAYVVVTCMLQRRMWGVLGPVGVGNNNPSDMNSNSSSSEDRDSSRASGGGGSGRSLFWWALFRMNAVMVCCTASFLVRAFLIASTLLHSDDSDSSEGISKSVLLLALQSCFDKEWVPAALPAVALLYVMRDTRHAGPPPPSAGMSASLPWDNEASDLATSSSGMGCVGVGQTSHYSSLSSGGSNSPSSSPTASVGVPAADPRSFLAPGHYQLVDAVVH